MANVAELFCSSKPLEPEEEEEDEGEEEGENTETLALGCLPYGSNDFDREIYTSDSDIPSPPSNLWFLEFSETSYPDPIFHEQVLDLVVSDQDGEHDDEDVERTERNSYFSCFNHDQVCIIHDLCDQSLHKPFAETSSGSDFRLFDGEEGTGLGLGSDYVSERFRKQSDHVVDVHDDNGDDDNGENDVSMMDRALSWEGSSICRAGFFVGRGNDPVSESGESSSIRSVESFGSIGRCRCSGEDCDCSGNFDYLASIVGFGSDSDEEENFNSNPGEDLGSEPDSPPSFPFRLDFEWEDVRIDEREVLSQTRSLFEECMVINGDEEIPIAEIQSEQETGNGVSSGVPGRNLDWEVLLQVNDLEISPSDDYMERDTDSYAGDYVYTAEYEILFGQFAENDNSQRGRPPASKSFVDTLPSVLLAKEDLDRNNALCAVCMDSISIEERVKQLPCSHYYHGQCILPWLTIRNTCPVCRFEMPTDDPDYEHWMAQRDDGRLLENHLLRYDFD